MVPSAGWAVSGIGPVGSRFTASLLMWIATSLYASLRPIKRRHLSLHAASVVGRPTPVAVRTPTPPEAPSPVPVYMPSLTPTIAPLGHERLIPVRNVRGNDVVVRGGVSGREYQFAAGQAREIPLADARLLVAEGDFAFSGGR